MYDCLRCGSDNIIAISAKCNDLCGIDYYNDRTKSHFGNAPLVLHKYENFESQFIFFEFCGRCGQIQHPDFRSDPVNVS